MMNGLSPIPNDRRKYSLEYSSKLTLTLTLTLKQRYRRQLYGQGLDSEEVEKLVEEKFRIPRQPEQPQQHQEQQQQQQQQRNDQETFNEDDIGNIEGYVRLDQVCV